MNGETRTEFTVDVERTTLVRGDVTLTETYHRVSYPLPSAWGGGTYRAPWEGWQFAGYSFQKSDGSIEAHLPTARGFRTLGNFKSLEDGAEAVIDFTRARLEGGRVKLLNLGNAQHRI